jgi:uracil-DNA glycosylase
VAQCALMSRKPTPEFQAHLEQLYACRACPAMIGKPVTGPVWGARVMLVGQAPGPHEEDRGRPFAYTAGKRLFQWYERLGVSEAEFRERVYIGAVARCFPGKDAKSGGDRVPSIEEIANCGRHLDAEVRMLKPKLLIAVGTLAAKQLLGEAELKKIVGRIHRVERAGLHVDVVVLPHPSGRSTWLNRPEHAALLNESLRLINEHPAWVKTFGERGFV